MGALIVVGVCMCVVALVHGPWWVGVLGSFITTVSVAEELVRISKEGPPEGER